MKKVSALILALSLALLTAACTPPPQENTETPPPSPAVSSPPSAPTPTPELLAETPAPSAPPKPYPYDTPTTSEIEAVINTEKLFYEYPCKTAVVTEDALLDTPYVVTYGGSIDDEGRHQDIFEYMNSSVEVKKGDIVLVIEELESTYRIATHMGSDPPTPRGYIAKDAVSFEAELISKANQCRFTSDIGTGIGQVIRRENDSILVSILHMEEDLWIKSSDATYDFDCILTDIGNLD